MSAPLDLRELFSLPWEGEGHVWRPFWARLAPVAATFTFRSEIANVNGDRWDVVDTLTFPDGTVRNRRMQCERRADGRIELTADDMPGGAVVTTRSDGFDFSPYVIRTPIVGRVWLPLRHYDTVDLIDADGTLRDRIELRLGPVLVGRIELRLRRADVGVTGTGC